MEGYNYHSLFYYLVISPLQNLRGGDGELLRRRYNEEENDPQFSLAYEPRNPQGYTHTYQRDNFIHHRSSYIIGSKSDLSDRVVLVREEADSDNAVIYRDAINYLFPEDSDNAFTELKDLMDKFYTVAIEERSGLDRVDTSKNRQESHIEVLF